MAFGVTDAGFVKPTDAELEAILVAEYQDKFGSEIILTPQTFLGQELAVWKKRELQFWDYMEAVYYAQFGTTASGVNLDRALFPFLRNTAQKASVTLTFTGDDATTVSSGTIVETSTGIQFTTTEAGTIEDSSGGTGTVSIPAIAVLAGTSGNLPVSTLVEIPTTIPGIDSVTNGTAATGGKDIETDADFLLRVKEESQGSRSSSVPAIRNALLAIEGVSQVTVTENDTDVAVDGVPSHSVFCVVNGSASNDTIAQALFEAKAAGIGTHGSINVDINYNGQTYPTKFSKSIQVNIYVDIILTVNSLWVAANADIVKLRVLQYIGGVDSESNEYAGLSAGQDVKAWQIIGALYELTDDTDLGIDSVSVELSKLSDPSSGETSNIAIDADEEAISDLSFINVFTS